MVGVVVALECMVELEQGRSSYNDANKLVVVVEQVVMGLLVALEVLEVLAYPVLLARLGVLVVHLVLALLVLLGVPSFLLALGVLELVVVVVVAVGVEVGEEVGVVGKEQLGPMV